MSILSDYFVATADDAQDDQDVIMDDENDPDPDRYLRVEHKGFTGIALSGLGTILADVAFDPKRHLLENVAIGEEMYAL